MEPIRIKGKDFKSLSDAAKYFGVKPATFIHRYRQGIRGNLLIQPGKKGNGLVVEVIGIHFYKLVELAEKHGFKVVKNEK